MKINPAKTLSIYLGLLLSAGAFGQSEILYEERSRYRDIIVRQDGNRRCMLFNVRRGDVNQTCVLVDDIYHFVFDYTRMSLAGLILSANPQSILVVGLGGGTLPMAFVDMYPNATIDVVEIDEAVVSVAKKLFFFEETQNMKAHVADGRLFIKRAGLAREKYDLIVLDAYTGDYIPEHMLTKEFLIEVRELMRSDSVLVANTFSASRLYDHESVTYKNVFGEFFNFRLPGAGNRIIIAQLNALPSLEELEDRAQQLSEMVAKYGVQISDYPQYLSTQMEWDVDARELTDQYSPGNLLRGN